MSRIRTKDTGPEIALRRALHAMGLRYRLHSGKLPGKPDLSLRRYRATIFVHGCFWHRHRGCKASVLPKSNVAFWKEKFAKNVARDSRNVSDLEAIGWRVFVVWECDLTPKKVVSTAEDLARKIVA